MHSPASRVKLHWRTLRRRPAEADIRIRSEVEAPFRALRLVLFGFFVVSASVGALIAATQVIAALNNAPQVRAGGACCPVSYLMLMSMHA
jgi:hypothetical protein